MRYNAEQIQQALDVYNKEQQALVEKEMADLMPHLKTHILKGKDNLKGIKFSTGELDDQYEIKEIEEYTLIVFQTWQGDIPGEEEEIEISELSYDQLKEIFFELDNK